MSFAYKMNMAFRWLVGLSERTQASAWQCPARLLLPFAGGWGRCPAPAGVRWIPDWKVDVGTDPVLPHRLLTTLAASAAVCFLTSHLLPAHPRGLCSSLSE